MKLVVFDCLFDDDKEQSDPIDKSPLEAGPVLMTFIIEVKSYMRVTAAKIRAKLHAFAIILQNACSFFICMLSVYNVRQSYYRSYVLQE